MASKPKTFHKLLRIVASFVIAGYSFLSLGAPQRALAATAPDTPSSVNATVNNDAITITWGAPLSDGGSAVTGWYARIRTTGSPTWSSMWVQPNLNQITFAGLTIGQQYDVAMAAVNDIGTSADSEVTGIMVGNVPDEVESLLFTNSPPSLGATWNPPTYAGSTPITSYDFAYSPAGEDNWDTYSVPTGVALVNGVPEGAYDVRVRAVNSVGPGDWTYIENAYLGSINYDISSCADLQKMRYALDAAFNLTNDIDCTGFTFLPVGQDGQPFIGSLEGNDHTITGLSVTVDQDYAGLFGLIDSAQVRNFSVVGSVTGNNYVGGVIGRASSQSVIENVRADVAINGQNYSGGLIGYADGPDGSPLEISNSSAGGSVSGAEAVGGLIGYATTINLDYTHATGIVNSSSDYAGGLIGRSRFNTITRSYATGNTTSQATRAGGLIGESEGDTISDSYARGNATTPNIYYAGGLIGAMNTSSLSRVYSAGVVNGYGIIGGLVGYNVGDSTITDSFSGSYVLPYADGYDSRSNNGLIGIDFSAETTYSNTFFNSINANPNCARDNDFNLVTSPDCTGINLQFETEMFTRVTDAPISNWQVGPVWQINDNDFPTLSPNDEPYILCEQTTVTDTTMRVACDVAPSGWGPATWEVQYKRLSDTAWTPVTLADPSIANINLSGLTPGTDYQVRFRFTNNWGTGEWGRVDATTTGTAPTTPSVVKQSTPISLVTLPAQIVPTTSTETVSYTLDDFTDYNNGSGEEFNLTVGQVIYFYVNGERHSATVKEIGADYVILTIASEPFDVRLSVDEAKDISVKQNGVNDISVRLVSVQNGQATLSFARIQPTGDVTPPKAQNNDFNYAWLLLLIIPAGAALIIARRQRS